MGNFQSPGNPQFIGHFGKKGKRSFQTEFLNTRKAANIWEEFFRVPTNWSVHGDYGRYRQYFLDLEDPDEMSEAGDPMKPLPLAKVKELWQDLPAISNYIDQRSEYVELRPLEVLIKEWLEGNILRKKGEEAMKTLKIEDIHSFAESNRPLTSELAGLIREKSAEVIFE